MLNNIHPLLSGELLMHLDRMGHSDSVVLTDAHYPAFALGQRVIDMPRVSVTDLIAAVVTVLPLDDEPAVDVMVPSAGELLPVHHEIAAAAGVGMPGARLLERFEFYDASRAGYLFVRTGEIRIYANAILRKGIAG